MSEDERLGVGNKCNEPTLFAGQLPRPQLGMNSKQASF